MQWLRGFRFTFVPIVLFLSISGLNLGERAKKNLLWIILVGAIIIVAVSILEFFGVKIPLTTELSGVNGLENTQYLQGIGTARLQSLLAGPNALSLYMMALTAFALGLFKKITPKLIWLAPILIAVLVLTFSRNALIGLAVMLIFSVIFWLKKYFGATTSIIVSVIIIAVVVILGLNISKSDKYQSYLTHGTSTSLRYEQIVRVWEAKYEIGFLGRGSGTAGPSSQNRLDGGPNHWSENIYLEIFEELGLIGLILYLTLIIMLLVNGLKNYGTPEGQTAFLIILGFAVSGIFLNNYTGQVGIFLLWLANGLAIQKGKNEKNLD